LKLLIPYSVRRQPTLKHHHQGVATLTGISGSFKMDGWPLWTEYAGLDAYERRVILPCIRSASETFHKIERKNLNLRTWINRLKRKII